MTVIMFHFFPSTYNQYYHNFHCRLSSSLGRDCSHSLHRLVSGREWAHQISANRKLLFQRYLSTCPPRHPRLRAKARCRCLPKLEYCYPIRMDLVTTHDYYSHFDDPRHSKSHRNQDHSQSSATLRRSAVKQHAKASTSMLQLLSS